MLLNNLFRPGRPKTAGAVLFLLLATAVGCGSVVDSAPSVQAYRAEALIQEIEKLATKKPLVVNLWATWCSPCVAELPHFGEVSRAQSDVAFLGVSADCRFSHDDLAADQEAVAAVWQNLKMPFDCLYLEVEEGGDMEPLASAFQLENMVLPQTLFFKDGNLLEVAYGVLSKDELEIKIRELLES